MAIAQDSSFAPDSTADMSPPPFLSPAPSPVIKRARVTYGRRRDINTNASDPDIALPSHSLPQRRSIPDHADEIVPDSDEFDIPETSLMGDTADDGLASDDSDNDDASKLAPVMFSWKQRLKEIDQDSDDEALDGGGGSSGGANAGRAASLCAHTSLSSPRNIQDNDRSSRGSPAMRDSSPLPQIEPDDLFGSSLPSLTGSSVAPETTSSPSPPPTARLNRRKRAVIDESDDDQASRDQSSPTSPPFPHSIATPKLRSSPTPPTSENDMSPAVLHKRKGKERARSVAPLQFDEEITAASIGDRKLAKAKGRPTTEKRKAKERPKRPKVRRARVPASSARSRRVYHVACRRRRRKRRPRR